RIENDQVTKDLGLKPQEGLRYAYDEFGRGGEEQREAWDAFWKKAFSARKRPESQRDLVDVKTLELAGHLNTYFSLQQLAGGLQIMPTKDNSETWPTLADALSAPDSARNPNPAATSLEKILDAYTRGDVKKFNKEVDAYTTYLNERMPAEMAKVRTEAWF